MAGNETAAMRARLEMIIGRILRTGVVLAAAFVLAGGIMYLAGHAFEVPDYHAFNPDAAFSRNLYGIVVNALALDSYGIIQLGLLLLVATPIVRVLFSVIAFAAERDYVYVTVTVIVLAILLYSLLFKGA